MLQLFSWVKTLNEHSNVNLELHEWIGPLVLRKALNLINKYCEHHLGWTKSIQIISIQFGLHSIFPHCLDVVNSNSIYSSDGLTVNIDVNIKATR